MGTRTGRGSAQHLCRNHEALPLPLPAGRTRGRAAPVALVGDSAPKRPGGKSAHGAPPWLRGGDGTCPGPVEGRPRRDQPLAAVPPQAPLASPGLPRPCGTQPVSVCPDPPAVEPVRVSPWPGEAATGPGAASLSLSLVSITVPVLVPGVPWLSLSLCWCQVCRSCLCPCARCAVAVPGHCGPPLSVYSPNPGPGSPQVLILTLSQHNPCLGPTSMLTLGGQQTSHL